MKHVLTLPLDYSLRSVILSHGWSDLPPFDVSEDREKIRFAISGKKSPVVLELSQVGENLEIQSNRKLTGGEINIIRKMFGLDLLLHPFLDLAHRHQRPWIRENRMGRMLRGQTVFEDLIKLILTTNCTWGLTKKMVSELCLRLD